MPCNAACNTAPCNTSRGEGLHPLFTPCTKCHAAAMLFWGAGKFCGPGAYSCQSGKAVAAIERSRAATACVRSGCEVSNHGGGRPRAVFGLGRAADRRAAGPPRLTHGRYTRSELARPYPPRGCAAGAVARPSAAAAPSAGARLARISVLLPVLQSGKAVAASGVGPRRPVRSGW